MEINRFRFTDKTYDKAIKVLKGTLDKKKSPAFLKRFRQDITLKDGKLFYKDKEIVKASDVENKIRDLLYNPTSKNPWSRDAGYAALPYIGISRRKFATVVSKQRVKRESDNVPPSTKKKGKKLHKKGQIEIDLTFISRKDLANEVRPQLSDADKMLPGQNVQYYVLAMVDKLTSLFYAKYLGKNKKRKHVMKAVHEGGKWFAKELGVDYSKLFYLRDHGTEFSPPSELRGLQIKLGSSVEQSNSHFQRVFHRLLAAKRGGLASATTQAMAILNNSKSTISKMTPEQAAKKGAEEIAPLYNKKRAKGEPDKYKPLAVGTKVRLVTKKPKGTFYKAYQKTQWSKQLYTIAKVGKTKPFRYKVNGKWYGRDQLSGPMEDIDQEGEKIIKSRTKKPAPEPKLVSARTKKKEAQEKARQEKKIAQEKIKKERAERKKQFDSKYPAYLKLIKWVDDQDGKDYGPKDAVHYNKMILQGREMSKELKKYKGVFKQMNYFKHFEI